MATYTLVETVTSHKLPKFLQTYMRLSAKGDTDDQICNKLRDQYLGGKQSIRGKELRSMLGDAYARGEVSPDFMLWWEARMSTADSGEAARVIASLRATASLESAAREQAEGKLEDLRAEFQSRVEDATRQGVVTKTEALRGEMAQLRADLAAEKRARNDEESKNVKLRADNKDLSNALESVRANLERQKTLTEKMRVERDEAIVIRARPAMIEAPRKSSAGSSFLDECARRGLIDPFYAEAVKRGLMTEDEAIKQGREV